MQERMRLVQQRFYPCIKEEIFPVSQSNENFFEWRKIELEEKQEDQLGREFDKWCLILWFLAKWTATSGMIEPTTDNEQRAAVYDWGGLLIYKYGLFWQVADTQVTVKACWSLV